MCGIWASIGLSVDASVIDAVAHRGPDGQRFERMATPAGALVMAHRRLAILDESAAGLQPMHRGSRSAVVLNGELYNYIELRAELQAQGECFTTDTDTEVLLAAYERWGVSCLERLRGMFAFVLYDKVRHTLFIARDRFGIKPLYLCQTELGFAVASEIKQFRCIPGFAARADLQRVHDFVVSGLTDQDADTMFAGVQQMPGGTLLEIDLSNWRNGELGEPKRWYRLPAANSLEMPLHEAAERYRALLDDAVRLHLRADVAVGSCLSGGLDSSSIVVLASRRLDELRVRGRFATITAAYDAPEVDERRFADALSAHAGIANHQVFPSPEGLLASFEKLVWHQDEPFGSSSIFAQWCVFERAKELGIKVMLDGQGADEHLGGYHFYFATYYRQLAQDRQYARMGRLYRARRADHGVSLAGELKLLASGVLPWAVGNAANRWFSGESQTLFRDEFKARVDRSLSPAERAVRRAGLTPPRRLGTMLSAQTQATNLPMLLHYEDRSSMAHGIEARVPFLDHPLVEFAIALGDRHKIECTETKVLLRRAMADALPALVAERKDKIGFTTPEQRWFTGSVRQALLREILALAQRLPGIFDQGGLQRFVDRVTKTGSPLNGLAWRLACLSVWSRVHNVGT